MTRERAIDDILAEAVDRHAAQDHGRTDPPARDGLADARDTPELLRSVLRAQIALGEHDLARAVARRLASLPAQGTAVDLFVEAALDRGGIAEARAELSRAEAEATLPGWHIAHLKARIALAGGDLMAAKAILVMAIERAPENAALRALLTEAMVAAGTASDARAVLGHLGQPPTLPPGAEPPAPEENKADPGSPARRAPRDLPGSKIS